MIWQYLQENNFNKALDAAITYDRNLFEDGEKLFTVGDAALEGEDYDLAIKAFNNVVNRKPLSPLYGEAKMAMISAKNKK